ncbi:hypothetical protein SRABI112_01679 [Pseudomonas mediterranea]|nr:hypothetical protein SRABI112_01679 [Pseudomonas mediterranea]
MQAKRQRRLVHIAEHVAEEAFMFFTTHPQAGLSHIVAVRRGGVQLVSVALQIRQHLALHHFHRRMIEGDVMEQQHRDPALISLVFSERQAHQRCLGEVEGKVPGIETIVQLFADGTGLRIRDERFQPQTRLAPDHLLRFVEALPDDGCAQDVVAIDHHLQGLDELVQTLAAVEGELRLQHVGVALFGGQMVIEDAFLQRRQRVDVLYVAHATRHFRRDMVDGVLIQATQRQHVGRDARAIERDAVGRHLDFVTATHRCRQRHQGRLAEQYAHVGTQAGLAHPLDQADGQQ